ncbi:stage II sporulation protein M [Candidatus Woesearchaeota archaeon]|nr:stage II sporulation protein M [Candidatus Woesearchaeota archaeon]
MVLEQIYSSKWIEKKSRYAFLMGLSYSIIGIFSAMFLFPADPGLAAIAFTSLLILPSLNKLLSIEENQAARKKKFDLIGLFKDHNDIFRVYVFLFLGILLSFAFFSLVWPVIATSKIFAQQVNVLGWATGQAYTSGSLFGSLLSNNLKVLVFCLLASFIYGSGAIFIITWNASVWGTIFGIIARESAAATGQNPFVYFALTLLVVFPHMILEASSYFIAAISGGIVSKAVLREKPFSKRFTQIIEDGLIMFIIAVIVLIISVYVEANITGSLVSFFNL